MILALLSYEMRKFSRKLRKFQNMFITYVEFLCSEFPCSKDKRVGSPKNGYAQLGPGDERFHQSSAFSSRVTSVSRTRPFELSLMLEGSLVEAFVLFP